MTDLASASTDTLAVVDDMARLAALHDVGILDTPAEESFDDIVRVAAMACDAPVALVSLIDRDRQWFKARIGFAACETDLGSSVCAHALGEPDLLVIPDLGVDPRTSRNPLVTGEPHLRFYAGAPLRTADGQALGSLCVIDRAARPGGLSEAQAEILRTLARQVMMLLELRRAVANRDAVIAERRAIAQILSEGTTRLRISEAHWRGLFERLSEALVIGEVVRDAAGRVTDWCHLDVNAAWGELAGIDPADAVGRTIREIFPDVEDGWVVDFGRVVETGEAAAFTRRLGAPDRWFEGRAFPLEGDRFAALFSDVTARIEAEGRRAALIEIGDQLRDLATVADMVRVTTAIVGRTLGLARCGLAELVGEGGDVTIDADWTADGVPSLAGRHRMDDYGDIGRELLRGETLAIADTHADPRTVADRARWSAIGVRAQVNIPMQTRGRTLALFIVHDSKPRTWSIDVIAFLRNVADRLTAAIERVRAEAQQNLLNGELSHRMKNMLAMIQAIATQSFKRVAEKDALLDFQQRLQALAAAHDVLLQREWAAAPLREVASVALRALGAAARFTAEGPDVALGTRATLSTSLLLHELATNAAKYGALSVEGGQVALRWRIDAPSGELIVRWEEMGGPEVTPPTRSGFGSRLIRAGLIGTGGVELGYEAAGFTAEMRASLEEIGDP